MSTWRRTGNLLGVLLPLVGLVAAVVLLWGRMVGLRELTILAVGYVIAGLGITVGYHRLFTHRSFQTYRGIRYAFAILGQLAVQGNVVSWVANHRKHHQFADRSGDPHSPHSDRGEGFIEGAKDCGMPTPAGCSTRTQRPPRTAMRRTCWTIAACG